METFSASLALCEGNSPVIGEFPSQSQWRGALIFSLIWAWTNGWANLWDACDLRRHRAHYDVTVMTKQRLFFVKSDISSRLIWTTILTACRVVVRRTDLGLRPGQPDFATRASSLRGCSNSHRRNLNNEAAYERKWICDRHFDINCNGTICPG